MTSKTFTAHAPSGKCCKCKGQLRKGQKITIQRDECGVDFFHVECPNADDLNAIARQGEYFIQGSKEMRK